MILSQGTVVTIAWDITALRRAQLWWWDVGHLPAVSGIVPRDHL